MRRVVSPRMANRKPRPLTDTQAIEKVLGALNKERTDSPERRTPHDGWARMKHAVDELGETLRGLDGNAREEALDVAALALRFLVECT